jgi:hypothetical protein
LEGAIAIAQHQRHAMADAVDQVPADASVVESDIQFPVQIEVVDDDHVGRWKSRREGHEDARIEGSVAVPRKELQSVVQFVGQKDVELAVAVEVRYGNTSRVSAGGDVCRWLECPVSFTKENLHLPLQVVGDDQIQLAVVVEVRSLEKGDRRSPRREWSKGSKCSVSVAQQDGYGRRAARILGYGEI